MFTVDDYTNVMVARKACSDELEKVDIPANVKNNLEQTMSYLTDKSDRTYSEEVLLSALKIHLDNSISDDQIKMYSTELISKLLV